LQIYAAGLAYEQEEDWQKFSKVSLAPKLYVHVNDFTAHF